VFKNDDVFIKKLVIEGKGVFNLIIEGIYVKKHKFKVLIDGSESKLSTFNSLDKKYVYDRILKQNQNNFSFFCKTSKKCKINRNILR